MPSKNPAPTKTVERLLDTYPIISDQVNSLELRVILEHLSRTIHGKQGSVVEFGCYTGTTSLFISRIIDPSTHSFHVYDSFEGLPEKTPHDESPAGMQFKPGALRAQKKQFITNYKKAGLTFPTIHKGWFSELQPTDIPENILFAFLDGDYYESIRDSLRLITPKLSKGAVIVVDDYVSESLPGAKKAVDEWCQARHRMAKNQASLGITIY